MSTENVTAAAVERILGVRGSRVLVTGAASGIGLAIAEAMVECGARVVAADRDREGLEIVAKRFAELPGEVRVVTIDVTEAEQVDAAVAEAVDHWGGLDAAFANAGISLAPGLRESGGQLEGTDPGRWQRVLAVNLEGVFSTIRAASVPMKAQQSGRIVATASTAGLRADPLVSYSYAASKAAVVNVVRQAALELAPHGIRVNAIAPGPFHTNIGSAVRAEGWKAADDSVWARTVPLGRMGDTNELKGVALLLASQASSFMTGAVIPVDGGTLIAYPG
ncbi:MAG TPA: SDR family NAD(P)-dependent oxidoreductase [Acidimicrobiales bacterium]|nr:SDR family NAD(P)-dependent oxidoreductase [Acidimicrobiales bacterium]